MLRSLIPWREMPRSISRFEDEMERMMEDFLGRRESLLGGEIATNFVPTTNVAENENELEVTIDLPGLKPEEVNLELREGALWITGERKEEREEKEKTFHRMERRYGAFRRVIPLPGAVDEDKVSAEFHHGVLTVKLPKSEAAKPRHIEVKAGENGGRAAGEIKTGEMNPGDPTAT
jgi:HSP20 family protein